MAAPYIVNAMDKVFDHNFVEIWEIVWTFMIWACQTNLIVTLFI